MDLEKTRRLDRLLEKIRNKKRKCICQNCENKTIDGHVIALSQIKKITDETQIFSLINTYPTLRKFRDKKSYTEHILEKTGIEDIKTTASGMQGFCNPCDNLIFKKIEHKSHTGFDYEDCLLLAYKASAHEYRKNENWLNAYNNMDYCLACIDVYGTSFSSEILRRDFLCKSSLKTVHELEKCIQEKMHSRFSFCTFELNEAYELLIIGIYAFHALHTYENNNQKITFSSSCDVFCSFLVDNNRSYLIIGAEHRHLSQIIKNNFDRDITGKMSIFVADKELEERCLRYVSDVAILRVENWLCSIDFYKKNIEHRKDILQQSIYASLYKKHIPANLNIFSEEFDPKLEIQLLPKEFLALEKSANIK